VAFKHAPIYCYHDNDNDLGYSFIPLHEKNHLYNLQLMSISIFMQHFKTIKLKNFKLDIL